MALFTTAFTAYLKNAVSPGLQAIQRDAKTTAASARGSAAELANAYANTGESIDALADRQRKLNKDLAALEKNGGAEAFGDQIAALKAEIAQVDKALELKGAIKSQKQLGGELAKLRNQFRATQDPTEQKRLAAEIQKTEAAIKEQNAALRQMPTEVVEDASSKFAGMRQNLMDNLQSIPGVGGAIGALTNPLGAIAAGAAGFGYMAVEAFNAGQEVYKFGQKIGQMTGLTGTELQNLTAEVTAVARTFGHENEEVFKAANAMSKQMGISFDEALSNIQKGFLAGADANGEFLEGITEYSTQFKAAGFSAEEFVAISTQATKAGVFSDKGLDLVKEFGLRIREQTSGTKDALTAALGPEFTNKLMDGVNKGTISSAEALKTVSKALNDTKVPAAQLQTVIADVFGGPGEDAGMDYIQMLSSMTGDVDTLIDRENGLVKVQEQQMAAQEELAALQYELGGSTGELGASLDLVKMQMQILFYEGMAVVAQGLQWVQANMDSVKPVLVAVGAVIATGAVAWGIYQGVQMAATAGTTLMAAAQWALNAAMSANPIGIVIVAVGALVGALTYAYMKFEEVRFVIAGLWEAAKTVFTNIYETVKGLFTGVADIIMGAFSLDPERIKKGLADAAKGALAVTNPVGMALAASKGVGDAFNKGYNDKQASEAAEKALEKKGKKDEKNATVSANAALAAQAKNGMLPGAGATDASKKAAETNISTDPGKTTNITLNVGKLVESLVIKTENFTEGVGEARDNITRMFLDALNDTVAVAGA